MVSVSNEKDNFGLPDVRIRVTVANSGVCDTDDVVQIYVKNADSYYAVKNPALCAFKRIHVKAGQRVTTEITVLGRAFSVVNDNGERFADGAHFELYVGTMQPDARSKELTEMEPVTVDLCLQ